MIQCASCGATCADGLARCAKCGRPLAGSGSVVAPASQQARDEQIIRELKDKERIRRLRISHAITGALTFFVLNLLLGLPTSFMPINLLINAGISTVFGLPIGYLISCYRGGVFRGAMISAGTFMIVRVILGLLAGPDGSLGLQTFAWGIAGVIPGAFIGMHVENDE